MIATAEANSATRLIEPAPLAFMLPHDLEAGGPPEARGLARDEVRLMVSDRRTDRIEHASFRDLASFLRPGDLVVANDSATIPAALKATRADGSSIDLHLSTQLDDETWIVEPRKTEAHRGERLSLPGGASLRLLETYRDSHRLWVARLSTGQPTLDYLARHRVADRPDRFEPRKRKGRPVRFEQMTRPHGELKREMANGVIKI